MPRRAKQTKSIEAYSHEEAKRKNNPHVGLVSSATDKLNGRTMYAHDSHIDPYLSWAGKKEGSEFDVQNVSLHIHERVDPKRIVQHFLKQKEKSVQQLSLFEQPENEPPLNKAIDFYKHEQDWSNRLIAGDSLLVMNSLLNKEGMAGKVQMIYIDPPYGIKYNSNFQPFTSKTTVQNRDADIPAEPEMIKAYKDTWELEIHSYLTYLRDRLLLTKELLKDSGSCFLQINDENLNYAHVVMAEIFGKENLVSVITFKKSTVSLGSKLLGTTYDYIIWYAKDINKIKYRQLFREKEVKESKQYGWLETPNGDMRITSSSNLDEGEPFQALDLLASGYGKSTDFDIEFGGRVYKTKLGKSWKTTREGIENLKKAKRLIAVGDRLYYKLYFKDYPVSQLLNVWDDTRSVLDKIYAVQTDTEPIKRCLLMCTDPGDLVFDPTCGSGTTAFVAEQWGRRWITCDTSRVSIALAKARLMTAYFNYYKLAHPTEGVSSGFDYKKVPHITLGSIANNEPTAEEDLYNQPIIDRSRIRVTGPFTVEAVPSLRVKPFAGDLPKIEAAGEELARAGETSNQSLWRDELKATGIRAVGGKKMEFSRIEPMKATRFLHAEGEVLEGHTTKRVVVSFGPDYGPIEQRQVEEAIKEARSLKQRPDMVVFAAFHFDPEAAKDIDQIKWDDVQILKAQMSVDLLTGDLRKKRSSNQSYWLIGQPDVEVLKGKKGTYKMKVNGFDYYDPVSGEIESKSTKQIAMWFLDADYDERSLFPEQVFFPQGDKKRDWTKLARSLNSDVDKDALEAFTGVESLPFKAGQHKKVAVKIIDNRGIESFVIKKLA